MRIAVINTVNTRPNGITNVIFNLYDAMDKSDVTIDLIAINKLDLRYVRDIENGGGRVITVSRSFLHIFGYLNSLKKIIGENGYDIVHVHGSSHILTLEMLAAKRANCKVRISHSHNTTCTHKLLHRILTPIFYSCTTHCLACGEAAGKWMFGKKPFTVINNGIDIERFGYCENSRQLLREKYGIPSDVCLLGHVGCMNEQKNHSFLIDVFAKLISKNKRYRLMLVGTGYKMPEIESKVQALDLNEYVIFVGATDDVPQYLSAIDLIVMPSLWEGLPLSLIEEQANGLKCIVSDVITREVDKTGAVSFLPLNDEQAWVSAIEENALIYNRKELSRVNAGKIKACGYDIGSEAAKLKSYYYNCLRG